MKSAVAITALTVCLVAMVGSGISLKCYWCDNAVYHPDSKCEAMEKGQSKFLIKCPQGSIKCGVFRTYDYDKERLISTRRRCLTASDDHYCSYLDSVPVVCTSCSEDGCNNS